jgi:hypothetical protein
LTSYVTIDEVDDEYYKLDFDDYVSDDSLDENELYEDDDYSLFYVFFNFLETLFYFLY